MLQDEVSHLNLLDQNPMERGRREKEETKRKERRREEERDAPHSL